MNTKKPQEYIANISKASAYFALNNGPIKELVKEGKITEEEATNLQKYMQNHLSYLYFTLAKMKDNILYHIFTLFYLKKIT